MSIDIYNRLVALLLASFAVWKAGDVVPPRDWPFRLENIGMTARGDQQKPTSQDDRNRTSLQGNFHRFKIDRLRPWTLVAAN